MGRRRVEIKRIEDKSSRQVTFCKRRNGLMEKARQLSILCESSVAVLIVSATGKLYSYSSGDSIAKILSRFEIQQADDPKTSLVLHKKVYDMVSNLSYTKLSSRGLESEIGIELVCSSLPVLHQKVYGKDLAEKSRNYLSHNELLEIVQCKLEKAKSDNVSIDFLKSLEEQLKTALSITRDKKTELMMEFVKTLQEKEKLLREENQVLRSQLSKMKKSLETEEARAMPPENSSSKNPPETLLLLK